MDLLKEFHKSDVNVVAAQILERVRASNLTCQFYIDREARFRVEGEIRIYKPLGFSDRRGKPYQRKMFTSRSIIRGGFTTRSMTYTSILTIQKQVERFCDEWDAQQIQAAEGAAETKRLAALEKEQLMKQPGLIGRGRQFR